MSATTLISESVNQFDRGDAHALGIGKKDHRRAFITSMELIKSEDAKSGSSNENLNLPLVPTFTSQRFSQADPTVCRSTGFS